jgi:hypothetical protein
MAGGGGLAFKKRGRFDMTELWQVGIVHRPLAAVITNGLDDAEITWLPELGPFRFNADPFGLWHDDRFTVMVEAYDYRNKRGEIHYYTYDRDWRLLTAGPALRQPYHLSYPQLIRHQGEIYMLPEAHQSGRLTLYRAEVFPAKWTPAADLMAVPAIDATVFRHDMRWWMAYSLPGVANRAMRELHLAFADDLMGAWTPHPGNPLRTGLDASRPGGQAMVIEGVTHLPMQDCTRGYGAGLNLLRLDDLTPQHFSAQIVKSFAPDGLHPRYGDGLHTLSGDGEVTLIDVKRHDDSPGRWRVDLRRRMGRWLGWDIKWPDMMKGTAVDGPLR